MVLSFGITVLLFGLLIATVIIWLPYVWRRSGRHLRRSEGPWLRNFDRTRLRSVLLRDTCYTIGLWFCLLFLRLTSATPLFWVVAAVGMVALFTLVHDMGAG
jgi:hypothetical protein